MNPSLDPNIFRDQKHQTLVKLPKSINGQQFKIEKLTECKVYILDITEKILIDNCVKCEFYIAPVKTVCLIKETQSSVFSVACRDLQVENSSDVVLYLFCQTDPKIKSSFDMKFAPYNFSYPDQDKDFNKLSFDVNNNHWCKVHDSSSSGSNFSLLPANQFKNVEKTLDGLGRPVNPVPIPLQYGGMLKTEIVPGASSQRIEKSHPGQGKENTLSETQKEINDKKDVFIYFVPGSGFGVKEEGSLGLAKNDLNEKLDFFNEVTHKFYSNWAEYLFAILLAVIGFFLVLLMMSLLKMSSEWKVEALGLFFVGVIGSLCFVIGYCLVMMRRIEKVWMEQMSDIGNKLNQEYFEGIGAKLLVDLTVLTIKFE